MTNVTKLKIGGTEYSIDYDSLANKPDKATSSTLGLVKPDGTTITVDSNGIISKVGESWTISNRTLINSLDLNASTDYEIDLSSYLPDDSNNYEVWFNFYLEATGGSGHWINLQVYSDVITNSVWVNQCTNTSSTNDGRLSNVRIPIGTGRKLTIVRSTGIAYRTGTCNIDTIGYRKI